MSFLGHCVFRTGRRPTQRDQYASVQAPHGVQAAALVQFGHEIGEHGVEHGWFGRVEYGPDLAAVLDFAGLMDFLGFPRRERRVFLLA